MPPGLLALRKPVLSTDHISLQIVFCPIALGIVFLLDICVRIPGQTRTFIYFKEPLNGLEFSYGHVTIADSLQW